LLDALLLHALADVVQDLLGGLQADIGADQDFLEFLPQVVVDLAALEGADEAAEPGATGALDRLVCLLDELLG
jgi:hypothetical protein